MSSLSTLQTELADLPAHLVEDALRHARWRANELRERERWRELIMTGTDQEIISRGQEYAKSSAVVLAQTYGDVHTWQELVAWADFSNPRRPVLMRGSKEHLIRANGNSNHRSPNGWVAEIFKRCVRLAKITAFTLDDFESQTRPILKRLHERYCLSHHYRHRMPLPPGEGPYSPLWTGEPCIAYVSGKPALLNKSERSNIIALRQIIERTDKLDDRLAAAKLHWHERMAT